jgi:hypothetical protein
MFVPGRFQTAAGQAVDGGVEKVGNQYRCTSGTFAGQSVFPINQPPKTPAPPPPPEPPKQKPYGY